MSAPRTEAAEAVARHYLPGGRADGGGIGRLVGYIADAAAARGEPHLVTDTRGPRWRLARSAPRLAWAIALMARDRLLAPARVQHVHVAGRGSTVRKVVLTGAARALGRSYVLHLHDYDYAADLARRPSWQRALAAGMFRAAARVIVLGSADRAVALDALGVDPARVAVLPNAAPDPGPRGRRRAGPARILFLGRLGPRKGTPELLAALAGEAMRGLDWSATLAGDGPVEAHRREAERLGLGDRVRFPGWLGEGATRALCADADILALPSRHEGLSMAVIEGLAHGLAVVATPVGAHPETIAEGAIFVPPGDADALGAALARLVADPAERARRGAAARALYRAQFGMEGYMRALDEVYRAARAPGFRAREVEA